MPRIDHIAVAAHDKQVSARFFSEIFGLGHPEEAGRFLAVHLGPSFTLHFADVGFDFPGQHYAFHVADEEFDAIRGRLDARGIGYLPGPGRGTPGTINHHHGGRGLYFDDPAGHHLEIITARYGA
ncbi:VOC family protein [Saccharopolyspora sp. HNM0983]|uniref:VOC family protein n=1 Tax=Saccharopolyspora montiporae TaxID=2781240 RepID=A0A929FYN1_9PSEU|nr:VOC family protein [Saccharopolyspora sp. HNM0983]MBE9373655.1 VOC family protein [Saccharopolyspora sp. HNM0983]